MVSLFKELEISAEVGKAWMEESLRGGLAVSAAALKATPLAYGSFATYVRSDISDDQIKFPEAPDVPWPAARAGLAKSLEDLRDRNALCVVIEDDLAMRTDSELKQLDTPSAFLGNRVVHWSDLKEDCAPAAADVVKESAMGYPLNAFVMTKTSAQLGLANGRPVPDGFLEEVASSLAAIVVAAFDATSFLVWARGLGGLLPPETSP